MAIDLRYNATDQTAADKSDIAAQCDANGKLKVVSTSSAADIALVGAVNETAPASDTASSGLNGRLQRIAQRLTTLIATVLSVKSAGNNYETVAASQSAQVMGGSGATGDYLSHVNIQPTSTSPGVVTILDNAVEVHAYPGGTVGADLSPIVIPVDAVSVSGAWKITTGANVKCTAFGRFT